MAAYQELEIEQGTDWDDELLLVDANGDPVDLTGYTARCDFKRRIEDAAALISLTTGNGRIVITPLTGSVLRSLTSAETANIEFRNALHDLILISASGIVVRICSGPVTVSPQITVQ